MAPCAPGSLAPASRSARSGTYEAAALLDTPQQQPVSLLRSARGMFDTGAAPTSAAFPEQAESPTASRHSSGELRPYVSPFAKPHSPSRQGSSELQMVPARQGSLGLDRQGSLGALQQLPMHTGQSPVRWSPGLAAGLPGQCNRHVVQGLWIMCKSGMPMQLPFTPALPLGSIVTTH